MSILIKDTTREERERIVAESIGNVNGSCDGCASGLAEMYLVLLAWGHILVLNGRIHSTLSTYTYVQIIMYFYYLLSTVRRGLGTGIKSIHGI